MGQHGWGMALMCKECRPFLSLGAGGAGLGTLWSTNDGRIYWLLGSPMSGRAPCPPPTEPQLCAEDLLVPVLSRNI